MTTLASVLSNEEERRLVESVGGKFAAYLRFTPGARCTRFVPIPGESAHRYPNESVVSDLAIFWTLFGEIYEILGSKIQTVGADARLSNILWQVIDDPTGPGQFWTSSGGSFQVETRRGVQEFASLARTLRNGYAHFHWHYDDLSATDYWNSMGWDTANAPGHFDLSSRGSGGYLAYIVDGTPPLHGATFWATKSLRILVAKYVLVRWHLYRFIRVLLDGTDDNLFDR
jgi:hypothetical protein